MLFWYDALDYIKNAATALVIAGSFAGIVLVLYFSLFKIGRAHPHAAVIFSTLFCCVFTVPLVTSFNDLVERRITGSIISESKAEINAQRAEAERLIAENRARILEREKIENELTIAKQSVEIEALNTSNKLLEQARLNMQSFKQIAELALTQANFKQTLVRKDPLTPLKDGWGLLAEYYNDEVLVIINHDINAKFGVDITEIKIAKIDADHISVSGISPKFIGADKNESEIVLKEIRRNNFKRGVLSSVDRQNDKISNLRADNKAEQYELEFQRKVAEGMELPFMDDAIIQLARNFIKIVFSPLYSNIEFDETEREDALPIMDYLAKELKENDEERYRLLQINERIFLNLDQAEMETEAESIPEER